MTIFKFDYLKSFENDLKQQLSVDKKYLPISKKLVALLREINPFLETVDKNIKQIENEFIKENLAINKTYAENIENYTRSLKIIIEKNQSEIEKSQKLCQKQIHDLNQQFKLLLENIETRIDQTTQVAQEKIKNAETIYSRDVSSFNKIINESKKKYQDTTLAIEEEKKLSIDNAKRVYDQKIEEINTNLQTFKVNIEDKIEAIKAETQYLTNENDDIYLSIKNNYSQLSIQFNKKINELKKHYNHALTVVEKDYQQQVKPIEKAIENLKLAYQEAQTNALSQYSEKLLSLNVLFDVQKENYEKKKERIVHEANEAITLLNSKLSAYREQTAKEKLQTSREMRDQMKSIEDPHEREKTNHQLTRKLNALDNELNKQILRTNKDILEKHRLQQRKLFLHDQQHLKEINDWRMQKALVEYEKKQEFAKIDLNFHHNMEVSEQQLKLTEQSYQFKKDTLLLTHNKDLLPLEYQLAIAQGVQERELNLLANDAHLLIADSKLNEKRAQNELDQSIVQADFKRKEAETLYQADMQVLNITIQLEMEKAKARRDYEVTEQELRTELAQLVFNKTKEQIEYDMNLQKREIELEKDIEYLENKFQLDTFKHELSIEIEKRHLIINEAKYKNQQRVSNEKANRLLKMYKNELEFNQEQTSSFLAILRKHYSHQIILRDTIIELYHLPSHPEVLKETIKIITNLHEALSDSRLNILEFYKAIDHQFYVKKIEDLTGYKYMLKHEDMMNYYDSEIQKIDEKKKNIEKEIKAFEDSFFANQTAMEKNQAFINQLNKIVTSLKSNALNSQHKHQDIKENYKLISNHEHEIKLIKKQLTRIEKDIDKKHLGFAPLDKELEKIIEKQKAQEKALSSMKHSEASIFYTYLNKNQNIYQRLALLMHEHDKDVKSFMTTLTEEVYLSDNFINQLLKKHVISYEKYEHNLELEHQNFLNLMLKFYLKNEREQKALIQGFQRSSKSLSINLKKSYQKRLHVLEVTHKKLNQEKTHHIQIQKEKFKKKLELEHMMFQKKLVVDQLTLRDLESKIETNGQKCDQALKTLNENQISIATQYRQDYESQVQHLHSDLAKQIASIDGLFDQQVKLLATQTDQIETKNQLILTKYEQTYQRHLITLEERRKNYDSQVAKAMKNQSERERNLELLIKRMNQKRERELKNIQFHLKRYQINTKNEQMRVLNKEMKVLRKSHKFRVKMLQLN